MNFFSSKTKTHADVLKDLIEQIYKASISLLSPVSHVFTTPWATPHRYYIKPEEPEPSPTIDDLQSVFSHWASQSFTSNFGYEHQGEHSNPPEEAPMSGSLDAYNAFCDIYDEDDKQEKLDFFLDALFRYSKFSPPTLLTEITYSGIQTLPGGPFNTQMYQFTDTSNKGKPWLIYPRNVRLSSLALQPTWGLPLRFQRSIPQSLTNMRTPCV